MDQTASTREMRRRVFRVIAVSAMGGVVVLSAAFLALRVSSMMPSVIEAPVEAIRPAPPALEVPLPRESTAGQGTEASSRDPEPVVTARPEVRAVRSLPPRPQKPQIPPAMSRAMSEPLTETERIRRTAAWLLRTHDRETAEQHVRAAIAFYPIEDANGAFWRQVLANIAPGVDR